MNDNVLSLLGLARRAGRLSMGFDPVVDSARQGQSRLILIASDISPKSRKELVFVLKQCQVPIIDVPYKAQDISLAIGKSVKIVSVNDDGFAVSVKKLLGSNNGEE